MHYLIEFQIKNRHNKTLLFFKMCIRDRDEEVKKRRADILMDIQYSVTEELNQNRVGNTYRVILDSIEDGMYNGRAYFDSPEIDSGIMFKSDDKLHIGDFVNVKITACEGYDLIGEKV